MEDRTQKKSEMNPLPLSNWHAHRNAIMDGLISCLITAVLLIPLTGIYSVQDGGGLALKYRIWELILSIICVFIGRFSLSLAESGHQKLSICGGLVLFLAGALWSGSHGIIGVLGILGGVLIVIRSLWSSQSGNFTGSLECIKKLFQNTNKQWSPHLSLIMVLIAVIFPFLPLTDRWILDLSILVMTYILLGWGLNIVVGLAGLLDLGYVAFYAVGAYSFALLAYYYQLGFWICLPLGALLAALFGILLGFPVLRLRGDYLAIVTLGFGEMIRIILINWVSLTQGPNGISGIPRPTFFGLEFKRRAAEGAETFHQYFDLPYRPIDRVIFLFYITLGLVLLAHFFIKRIRNLPIGRAWEALREDEVACRSLGLNPTNIKLSAFALGAMFGGVAGTLFAARQGFISPESFTFIESAIILAVVVLGGMGSQAGVALAAVLLIGLPEWFRELEQYRMLCFGALMVIVMTWKPKGLLSRRVPSVTLENIERTRTGG